VKRVAADSGLALGHGALFAGFVEEDMSND
jgi:hypothetical protein